MKRMRFVFLDVDGVLLPFGEGFVQQNDQGDFTHESLSALQEILEKGQAEVVLSSTWRCAGGDVAVLEQFGKYAQKFKKKPGKLVELSAKPAFEHTTDPNVHTERQWEIGEWLEGAAGRGIQVDGWCAIDDEELVSLSEENRGGAFNARYREAFQGRHVKTESDVGLTLGHVESAVAALKRPWCSSELKEPGERGRKRLREVEAAAGNEGGDAGGLALGDGERERVLSSMKGVGRGRGQPRKRTKEKKVMGDAAQGAAAVKKKKKPGKGKVTGGKRRVGEGRDAGTQGKRVAAAAGRGHRR